MKNVVFLIGLGFLIMMLSSTAAARDPKDNKINKDNDLLLLTFEEYVQKFGKVYSSPEEYEHRRGIFERHVGIIMEHNQQNQASFRMGINAFTDHLAGELPLGHDKSHHPMWKKNGKNQQQHSETTGTLSSSLLPSEEKKSKQLSWDDIVVKTILEENRHSQTKDEEMMTMKLTFLDGQHEVFLPKMVDWRQKGVSTPIKNQGGCGSCWAFAATAALESHVMIQTRTLYELSVQELVSCVTNVQECGGEGGCAGSTAELAYEFVAHHGMTTEWNFAYQSYHGAKINCTILPDFLQDNEVGDHNYATYSPPHPLNLRGGSAEGEKIKQEWEQMERTGTTNGDDDDTVNGAVASIIGFVNLPSNDYVSLMVAVATMGPVVVNVAATGWGLYDSGIFDDAVNSSSEKTPTRDIDHAVVLEGYGTDEATGLDYWLVRNSWGPLWGEDGYIRLKRVDPSTLDDPTKDCQMDDKPADGVGCRKDSNGKDIDPSSVSVCGTSGILFDGVIPVGGHLLHNNQKDTWTTTLKTT